MALRPVSGLGVQRYVPHLAGIPSIAWSFELALAQYPVPGILFSSIQREPGLQQNVIIANNATSSKVQIEDREGNEGPRLVVSGGVEAGDVLMGGASGAGRLLLNTKASQEAACSRAPATIVLGRKPESHDAGVSRFGEIGSHPEGADTAEGHAGQVERSGMSGNAGTGSHLEGADTAEGHAGQVDCSGSSGNARTGSHLAAAPVTDAVGVQVGGSGSSELTKNGSHLVAAGFSDKPRRSCDGGPQRAVQNQASCCTGRPRRTVLYRKRPRSVREAHLSAGAACGGGSKHRCDGKLGDRWLATGGLTTARMQT